MTNSKQLKNNRATKILSSSELGKQILVWLDLALENNSHFTEYNSIPYCSILASCSFSGVSLENGIVFEDSEGVVHLSLLVQSKRGKNGNEDLVYIMLESKYRSQSHTIFHTEFPVVSKSRKK